MKKQAKRQGSLPLLPGAMERRGKFVMENTLLAGESVHVEYKAEVASSETYMKTVVAFANTDGGRIVFGIADKNLKVIGINPDTIFKTMDTITNAISDSCEPKIYPNITE